MAGYLGTKAVLLSTTAADVVGNAEIGGDLTVDGTFTSQGIDDNASATAMTLDASGNVGIGTSSPFDSKLQVTGRIRADGGASGGYFFGSEEFDGGMYAPADGTLAFSTNNTERMRIDSSGNLLVGTTSFTGTSGVSLSATGYVYASSTNDVAIYANRENSDGPIAVFRKDGSTVGSIGVESGDLTVGNDVTTLKFHNGLNTIHPNGTGSGSDGNTSLGWTNNRFNDIYATNGTIQTSDRNEKQDIDVLSDAEQRVAVACKGLLRKFRWKDAVAEKGDDARIHFGIIAQDLQDAFTAEGLDARRYGMFISNTWWEHSVDVPAVEAVEAVYEDVVIPAVLDEEGNEVEPERTEQQLVTEAVEAKDAYTRTDTYETLEEAPEGATERTRLGVRYPELLAFIIGAM